MNLFKKGLSAYQLKMIAIIAMFANHSANAFIPKSWPLYQIIFFLSRVTFPIMCFFIAEGYHYTHHLKRYVMRIAVFALISHVPFVFFANWLKRDDHMWGVLTWTPNSVLVTLLFGLLSLYLWDKFKGLPLKILLFCGLWILLWYMNADWWIGFPFVLAFGLFRGNRQKQIIAFMVASIPFLVNLGYAVFFLKSTPPLFLISYLGIYFGLAIIQLYNGSHGSNTSSKWLFYFFYPLHFIVISHILFPLVWPFMYSYFQ